MSGPGGVMTRGARERPIAGAAPRAEPARGPSVVEVAGRVEAALEARGAVRRGRHVRFRCPAHDDGRPSADLDPVLGVWCCRACGAGGGVLDLARRLGLDVGPAPRRASRPPRVPPPPAGVDGAAWAAAWRAVVDRARRDDARCARVRERARIGDWLRSRHQAAADGRVLGTALGDTPAGWRLLRLAARVATRASAVEAALDRALADQQWADRARLIGGLAMPRGRRVA